MLELQKRIDELTKQKDDAYWERNQCVSLLSKLLPSYLGRHEESDESWERDWMNIVYVYLPNGQQLSWHIHDTELCNFDHLERKEITWDGHDTITKYRRMKNYIPGE